MALIEVQKSKVEFYDAVMDSNGAKSLGDVAKMLGINGVGRNKVIEILCEEKVLMKNAYRDVPMQRYMDRGYFKVVLKTRQAGFGQESYIETLVYQKGIEFIAKKVTKHLERRHSSEVG
ncbi:phage antirepressor YoqD-like protein [Paenibacillus anaericanus]|nr:phage antirepressor YoqD-like protein [Paenibacillus anaericanus]